MCGITGFYHPSPTHTDQDLATTITRMNNAIAHRGPDGADIWLDAQQGIALGHRRLAIIDLSAAGNQPMTSACGRYVIVYNGEVYNADQLRQDLSDRHIAYRGYSDTEAILESCAAIGVHKTTEKLIGMFAFALWDKHTQSLCLVRDRMGIKPLYWAQFNGTLLFASELKALIQHPDFKPAIQYDALASYFRHSYVPAPYSIYQNVYKLSPGHILTYTPKKEPQITPYWALADVAQAGITNPWHGTAEEGLDALESLLKDSVQRRMMADVPLGAFLSGGIDSSLVASLMQAQSTQKVRTFSIGFHEQGYNEAHHAKNVADHLGTDHTELYVTPTDAQNVIPKLGHMFDEPFADSSQIPTYLVSAMTKQHVTVALSGDGGDELFCGYSRYFAAARMGQKVFSKPYALRRIAAGMLHMLPPAAWDACGKIIPASKRPAHFGDRLHKLADLLPGKQDDFFQRTLSHWDTPAAIARHGAELNTVLFDPTLVQSIPDFYQRMQYIDTLMYLPDDILTKVDRTSMAVSLEARVPLLDHRVVELSWRLPHAMKVRHGQGKWALKNILYRYVPQDIIDRPKMGFGVPVGDWIKAPLRDWAENLLSEETLNKHGLVNTAEVRRRWQEHLHSQRNWQAGLWNILMLQSWAEEWN